MGVEAAGLQSGFVIGIIIAAVLLAHRFGGADMLALRAVQLSLGLVLMMAVFAVTTAVDALLGTQPELFGDALAGDSTEGLAGLIQHNSVVGSIHLGLAIVLVAGGVGLSRRWHAIAPGFLLAGILLMLLSSTTVAPSGILSSFYLLGALLPPNATDAGDARNIARALVLLAGVALLVGTIHLRWERESGGDAAAGADPRGA